MIDATLRDRAQTALAAVATPEQAAVDELLELRAALGGQLDAELVNGVAPARFTPSDARALRDAHERLELRRRRARTRSRRRSREERASREQRVAARAPRAPRSSCPLIGAPEIARGRPRARSPTRWRSLA